MKNLLAFAVLTLSACQSYQPTSAYPPTTDKTEAKMACSYEQATAMPTVGLIDGLANLPQGRTIFETCMARHGWALRS